MKQKLKELEEEAAKLRNTQVSTSSGTSASDTASPAIRAAQHSSRSSTTAWCQGAVASVRSFLQLLAFCEYDTPFYARRTVSLLETC
jgi:hypothetical protein